MSAPHPQSFIRLGTAALNYVAGYLEGEGSFCCCKHGRKLYPTICAESRDREPLERLQLLCGGNISKPIVRRRNKRHSPTFRWALTRRLDCKAMATQLRYLMSPRRQQQIDTLLTTI
jgi:hypothetical protein